MSKLTLEQVRDEIRNTARAGAMLEPQTCHYLADAIDAELKARGEPVAEVMDELGFPIMTWLPTNVIDWPVGTKLYTAPPAPKITNEALVQLARRCLWLAYVWNDHNFDAAHVCARKTAEDVGIESFEEANTWLQALKETP